MSDSDRPEHWWTWYICGYKGQRLISAKANGEREANYLAELLRKDGVEKIAIKNHGESKT